MSIIEIAAIVGVVSASITAGFVAYNTHKQQKVISSQIILDMLVRLRDDDFRSVVVKMKADQTIDELDLKRYLTHLEYIAIFWNDGVINFHHIVQIFGANFRLLNKNQQSLQILDNIPWDSDLYLYINKLRRRLV